MVELRCETDFVAKADEFVALTDELGALVAAKGEDAVGELSDEVDRLAHDAQGEHLRRAGPPTGGAARTGGRHLHPPAGRPGRQRGRRGHRGGDEELAHNIAVHIAFTKPAYLSRDEVPEADIAAERATVAEISRNEGKPEAALDKIVEGRMNGWFKDRVLLDQSYVRDEKQTIAGMLGSARIVAFAQVVVGA